MPLPQHRNRPQPPRLPQRLHHHNSLENSLTVKQSSAQCQSPKMTALQINTPVLLSCCLLPKEPGKSASPSILDNLNDPFTWSFSTLRREWDEEDALRLEKTFSKHHRLASTGTIRAIMDNDPQLTITKNREGWNRLYNKIKNLFKKRKNWAPLKIRLKRKRYPLRQPLCCQCQLQRPLCLLQANLNPSVSG